MARKHDKAGGPPAWAGPKKTEDTTVVGTPEEDTGETAGETGADVDGETETVPDWLPPGLRDGLPEHLGGGLPPGWGGAVPGLLNSKADRAGEEDGKSEDGTGDTAAPTVAADLKLLDDGTLFDYGYYLEQNPDVAAANMDPAEHFLLYGREEGRLPVDPDAEAVAGENGIVELADGTLFDSAYYLEQNPDVAAANVDPLLHYLDYGQEEGRTGSAIDTPVEGTEGDDQLTGDVADNLMAGGAGTDDLNGGAGTDLLNGGTGDDILTGGEGGDVFVFDSGGGNDTVTDYGADDILMLDSSYGFADATAVLEAATTTDGGDTVIALSDTDTVTLTGVSADQLTAEMIALF